MFSSLETRSDVNEAFLFFPVLIFRGHDSCLFPVLIFRGHDYIFANLSNCILAYLWQGTGNR